MTDAPLAAPTAGRPRLVARLVALAFFMQLLDATIIATALPAMAADFGVEPVDMSVGLTAYMLAMAVTLPAAGWIGERWGPRRVLVASIGLFVLTSLACALAGSLPPFVAARVAQGAAAALMAPVGRFLVLRHAPKSELMGAIATITWPALFAPVVGPVLGAWITESAGWEWNFLINLPLGAAAIACFLLLVPEGGPGGGPGGRTGGDSGGGPGVARPFDGLGFGLCALALAGLLGGIEFVAAGGRAWAALALLVVGLAAGVLAVRHLTRHAAPLFDLSVVRVASFRMATLTAGTLGRISINATPFLLPLLLQVGFGLSPLAAGQLVLVYFLGNLGAKSVTTPILRGFGFRRVLVGNGLLAALSIGALAALGPDVASPVLWAVLLLAGASRSLQFTALNTFAFADVGPAQRASSTTLSSMTQQVAMLGGVGLSVLVIRVSEGARGASQGGLPDFRAALVGMALLGALSAVSFLRLAPDAGQEVSGHRSA